jgi:hypothetical protein
MGCVLEGKCKNCGIKEEFLFGGNRFDYQSFNPVPAINLETNEFCSVNYFEYENNENYSFYSDDKLKGNNFDKGFIKNFSLQINRINNYCPICKNFAFDFNETIFTD